MTTTATVKFYRDDKKYGFLIPDDPQRGELFFHISALTNDVVPKQDDRVEYTLGKARNGKLAATSVKVL